MKLVSTFGAGSPDETDALQNSMPPEQAEQSTFIEDLDQSRVGEIGKRVLNDIRSIDPASIVDQTRIWTRDNPFAALGVALGTGLLLGIAIRSSIDKEATIEQASQSSRLADVVRRSGNELVQKARQASENVVSEVASKLSETRSIGDASRESVSKVRSATEHAAKETISFADTIVTGLVTSLAKKLSEWAKKR